MFRALSFLAASVAVGAFALAQQAPEAPPADDTDRLAEDFDSLFGPEPEPDASEDVQRDPTAPVELGPAPVAQPEPEPEIVEAPRETDANDTADASDSEADGEAADEDEAEQVLIRWNKYETAKLRGLDKITGRFTDIDMEVGTPVTFGTLRVEIQTCFQTPPDLPPESSAFIRVNSLQPLGEQAELEDPEPLIFSGWMFASSPGLNALEHPVYDVWVIECAKVETPATPG
ncbi:MAG: DUF2155 domain-containing protein [Pseudomonadota bacterium]